MRMRSNTGGVWDGGLRALFGSEQSEVWQEIKTGEEQDQGSDRSPLFSLACNALIREWYKCPETSLDHTGGQLGTRGSRPPDLYSPAVTRPAGNLQQG